MLLHLRRLLLPSSFYVQILGLENHRIPQGAEDGGVREMAHIAVRMAAAIRKTMPSLKDARVILCVESNVIWIVDTFNKALNELTGPMRAGLGSWKLVHNNKAYATTARRGVNRQTGEAETDPDGTLNLDLNTSNAYKQLMAQHVSTLLADGLLHWHRDLVSSATIDEEVRGSVVALDGGGSLATLRTRLGIRPPVSHLPMHDTLARALDEYDRRRMSEQFVKQARTCTPLPHPPTHQPRRRSRTLPTRHGCT